VTEAAVCEFNPGAIFKGVLGQGSFSFVHWRDLLRRIVQLVDID